MGTQLQLPYFGQPPQNINSGLQDPMSGQIYSLNPNDPNYVGQTQTGAKSKDPTSMSSRIKSVATKTPIGSLGYMMASSVPNIMHGLLKLFGSGSSDSSGIGAMDRNIATSDPSQQPAAATATTTQPSPQDWI